MTQIGAFPAGLVAGQPENVADVVTALNQIKTVVNGNIDGTNVTDGSLTTSDLSATAGILNTQLDATTVLDKAGISTGTVRRGKSIIATTESRTNVAYGTLTTPDQVANVVLPTDGLIAVAYQATWQESVQAAATAAIFVGANQVKYATPNGTAPVVSEARIRTFTSSSAPGDTATGATANTDKPLVSFPLGLASGGGNSAYGGDVTTGQIVGLFDAPPIAPFASYYGDVQSGPCYIFAAAGTYTISIQFKSTSGSVTAKNRRLWVWTMGF